MVSEINVIDVWKMLETEPQSILIDVRTREEIDFVGFVDLSKINAKMIFLPWRKYPNMAIDQSFTDELLAFINKTFSKSNLDEINLLFLCRSGSRSFEAAIAMSNSFYNCYNIIDGFEGSIDSFGHRGCINGWKANNLPWRQN